MSRQGIIESARKSVTSNCDFIDPIFACFIVVLVRELFSAGGGSSHHLVGFKRASARNIDTELRN
ncbi:hypothetical protein IF2G_05984 [Cordyceps javanica]|nr:hypothetical protein IF2G_05984 [Cordyceps javanica]